MTRPADAYIPRHLYAERYGPSRWWGTPRPVGGDDTLPGTERCAGCGARTPADQPCPRCARDAKKRREAIARTGAA